MQSGFITSVKRFALTLIILVIATITFVFLSDQIVAPSVPLRTEIIQVVRILGLITFGSAIVIVIRRAKHVLSRHVGPHTATVFQFFMILVTSIVVIFATLNIFQVPATTLLISGGIVSIVIGLVISTYAGNILAGTMVLMTNPFRVGDVVIVNNVPGVIEEISAMVTRIRNDLGGEIVVPNSAIMQGGVIVTRFSRHAATYAGRLPYAVGDRVYTTYMSSEGIVTELTPFNTKILLDNGREITFLNTSILAGSVAIAKITLKKGNEK